MKHSVYLITCNNDKQYAGYTSREPRVRLEEHKDDAKKNKRHRSKLLSALRVHGIKSFETLAVFDSEFEALLFERKVIADKELMTKGLNMSPGGEGRTMKLAEHNGEIIRVPRGDKRRRYIRKRKTRYSRGRRR